MPKNISKSSYNDIRVFKEAARQKIRDVHSGESLRGAKTKGGANRAAEGNTAAGGRLPGYMFQEAKKGKYTRKAK